MSSQRATVNIPVSAIPHVIGRGGTRIQEIRAQSGASHVIVDTPRRGASQTTVTIGYETPNQRIIAENMIRTICNNLIRVYAHPEINVILVVAGSLLSTACHKNDGGGNVAVDDESSDAVSFIPYNNNNNNNNTRGGRRYYKTGVKIKIRQPEHDSDDDRLTDDLQRMTLSSPRLFEDPNVIVVDQSVAERDSIEDRFAKKVSEYAQRELVSKKDGIRWRVEVGLGQLLFYELNRTASTSVRNFQNFTIGRGKDFKVRFDNRIPEDKTEPLVQFLKDRKFEVIRHEEEIAMHLLDKGNRISVNVLVDSVTDTLQPRYITGGQRKPIFLTYQHASLISNEAAEIELPNVPSIDMRIRLQTNEQSEVIPDTISDLVDTLTKKATRNAEGNLILEMGGSKISLDSMRVKRTDEFSDGTHTVAIEKIHDEHGHDVHTEVTINSDSLDIYTKDHDEIRDHIRKLLNFSRSIMENVFIDS